MTLLQILDTPRLERIARENAANHRHYVRTALLWARFLWLALQSTSTK
jgi:hypothetical protein